MSYNVDTWKVKRLENLKVPIKEFYTHEREDWHPSQPTIIEFEENTVEMDCGECSTIKGILKNNILDIKVIEILGEGSGTFIDLILEPALRKSSGILEVSCVWGRGDSINKLIVKDGNLEWKDIEI